MPDNLGSRIGKSVSSFFSGIWEYMKHLYLPSPRKFIQNLLKKPESEQQPSARGRSANESKVQAQSALEQQPQSEAQPQLNFLKKEALDPSENTPSNQQPKQTTQAPSVGNRLGQDQDNEDFKRGISKNPELLEKFNSSDFTPLMLFIWHGNLEMVEWILEKYPENAIFRTLKGNANEIAQSRLLEVNNQNQQLIANKVAAAAQEQSKKFYDKLVQMSRPPATQKASAPVTFETPKTTVAPPLPFDLQKTIVPNSQTQTLKSSPAEQPKESKFKAGLETAGKSMASLAATIKEGVKEGVKRTPPPPTALSADKPKKPGGKRVGWGDQAGGLLESFRGAKTVEKIESEDKPPPDPKDPKRKPRRSSIFGKK